MLENIAADIPVDKLLIDVSISCIIQKSFRHWKKAKGSFERRGKTLEEYARKRVPAGAHFSTPWLFEPTKRPDDRLQPGLQFPSLVQAPE